MSEYVENVNAVLADLRAWAQKNRDAQRIEFADKMDSLADKLGGLSDELVRLYGLTSALPADLGNVHDLPPELLEELSVAKTDELEDQLVTVIRAYGDSASLDQILVGLYRKFKVKQKRRFLQNKLYRMDTVWGVDGKKGIYTTTEPPPSFDESLRRATVRITGPLGTKELSGDADELDLTAEDVRHQFDAPPEDDADSEVPF